RSRSAGRCGDASLALRQSCARLLMQGKALPRLLGPAGTAPRVATRVPVAARAPFATPAPGEVASQVRTRACGAAVAAAACAPVGQARRAAGPPESAPDTAGRLRGRLETGGRSRAADRSSRRARGHGR